MSITGFHLIHKFYLKFNNAKNSQFYEYNEVVKHIDALRFPLVHFQTDGEKFNSSCAIHCVNSLLQFLPTFPCGEINWNSNKVVITNQNLGLLSVRFDHQDFECVNVQIMFAIVAINGNGMNENDITIKIDEIFVTYVNNKTRKCIKCCLMRFKYQSGLLDPNQISKLYLHSFDDNPALVTSGFDYCFYYFDFEHRMGGDTNCLNYSNVTSVQSFQISSTQIIVHVRRREFNITHSLYYPSYEQYTLDKFHQLVTLRSRQHKYFGGEFALHKLEHNINHFIRYNVHDQSRFLLAPTSKSKKYLNHLFDDIFISVLLYPILPDDLLVHILQFIYPDCPTHLMRFFFTLVQNSIRKIQLKRNPISVQRQLIHKQNQINAIKTKRFFNIVDRPEPQVFKYSSGRHNETKINLLVCRSRIAASRSNLFL